MILAHRVALNGVELDELDERINIKGIEEGAGKESISAAATAGGSGQRITGRHRDTMDVIVKFSMTIMPEELEARNAVLEKIKAWAAEGGYLTVNYKPNRRLYVECVQAPGAGDLYDWTAVYSITFRAYALPYWEEAAENKRATAVASSASVTMEIEGSAETEAEVTLENRSGMAIENVTISAAGRTMAFTALALGGNEQLIIRHEIIGKQRMLRILISGKGGTRSAMARRSEASSDDLYVSPGTRTFSFTADRACQMTVGVRGRFV